MTIIRNDDGVAVGLHPVMFWPDTCKHCGGLYRPRLGVHICEGCEDRFSEVGGPWADWTGIHTPSYDSRATDANLGLPFSGTAP